MALSQNNYALASDIAAIVTRYNAKAVECGKSQYTGSFTAGQTSMTYSQMNTFINSYCRSLTSFNSAAFPSTSTIVQNGYIKVEQLKAIYDWLNSVSGYYYNAGSWKSGVTYVYRYIGGRDGSTPNEQSVRSTSIGFNDTGCGSNGNALSDACLVISGLPKSTTIKLTVSSDSRCTVGSHGSYTNYTTWTSSTSNSEQGKIRVYTVSPYKDGGYWKISNNYNNLQCSAGGTANVTTNGDGNLVIRTYASGNADGFYWWISKLSP